MKSKEGIGKKNIMMTTQVPIMKDTVQRPTGSISNVRVSLPTIKTLTS